MEVEDLILFLPRRAARNVVSILRFVTDMVHMQWTTLDCNLSTETSSRTCRDGVFCFLHLSCAFHVLFEERLIFSCQSRVRERVLFLFPVVWGGPDLGAALRFALAMNGRPHIIGSFSTRPVSQFSCGIFGLEALPS